ncbi:hypothetical protein FLK61_39640 [Paenalkalicoccus suaedae]|uniref:Uncharacterized protein n=1 Tax=Paenalkalicoccus suaedae TaxID=2592382 RepID=A0A859FI24_9BACI|nr:hypothetical protein [Paenalkalicoccus suaedae]QKS72729.1 hypothetical protein FLK61_39640 [Paenalkalicoccus suaedae]
MGIFDFLKKSFRQEESTKEKYWSLSTNEEEILDPTWEQVKQAVEEATPEKAVFASLGYLHSGNEIEVIQAIQLTEGKNGFRFEALPPGNSYDAGNAYIKNDLSLDETLKLFEEFYRSKKVLGYKNWLTEKI